MKRSESRRVVLGRIAGLHGVRGWVKVVSHTEPRDAIVGYQPWLVGGGAGWREMRVAESRTGGGRVLVRLEGVDTRDAAAGLLGAEIAVTRDRLPPSGTGGYYWADLAGLTVEDREGRVLGTVSHVFATGANDVMVVQGDRERLIPFVVGRYVQAVDLDAGVIRVDWDADF